MKTKTKKLLPFNIQLFADGDEPEVEIDYKELYLKAKAEKDKASKEASDYKKALKSLESEEQTKKRELEAETQRQQEEMENLKRENRLFKFKSEISKGGYFDSEDIENLTNARLNDNDTDFAEIINQIVEKKLKKQKEDLMTEFKRNGRIPNGSSGGSSTEDSVLEMVKRIAKQN